MRFDLYMFLFVTLLYDYYSQRMDLDGDGKLDYEEFTTLIFNQKDRKLADASSLMQKRKLSKPKNKPTKSKKTSTSS